MARLFEGSTGHNNYIMIFMLLLLVSISSVTAHSLYGSTPAIMHILFLPILAVAYLCGAVGGVIAGLLLGCSTALIPSNFFYDPGSAANVLVRTLCFTFLGFSAGTLSSFYRFKRDTLHFKEDAAKLLLKNVFLSFSNTVDARDGSTGKHDRRVAANAYYTGRHLGLQESELGKLYWAGLLHDIGKIGIHDSILNGERGLTKEEWDVMRKHPEIGSNILSFLPSGKSEIRKGILHHHEQWLGGGYPSGLSGEEIHVFGRIIAVVDVCDAITSPRSYKKEISIEEALNYIRQNSGVLFDPKVVDAFVGAYVDGHIATFSDRETKVFVPPMVDDSLMDILML
jgi:HD-GYP domain-containing protein (c-di-GMP phosphodiesterase class II)